VTGITPPPNATGIAQMTESSQLPKAGGPAFDLVDTTKTVGAPLFALFEGRVHECRQQDSAPHPHAI